MPSLLSVYTSKSVHWFGRAAFPRKKKDKRKKEKKSHKEHILPKFNKPGGATGYSIGTKFGRLVGPFDLITHANFKLDRLRTSCVELHESLPSFRFSALHRLSPLTQLGPAGPLVIFYFIFSRSRRLTKTCRPILTYNSSNGAAWPKEVPFGGLESPQFKLWGSPGLQIPKI